MTKTTKDKKETLFYVTEEVRITRHDVYNITIEKLADITRRGTDKIEKEWQTEGYYPDVNTAIKGLIRKGLILDEKDIKSIEDYYIKMEEQLKYLEDVVRKYTKKL